MEPGQKTGLSACFSEERLLACSGGVNRDQHHGDFSDCSTQAGQREVSRLSNVGLEKVGIM